MPQKKKPAPLTSRVSKLENGHQKLTNSQKRLDNALAHLAEVFEQRDKEYRDMIAQEGKEWRERAKGFDERVDKLVSAIGALIQRMPIPPQSPQAPQ
jgi:hypothetical protein